ncbi:NAD-dependent epimerase/dehydratase family protein [Aliiroseovarius sp. S1339]|uniref:NAD-dependent epimerase/dehydratase family protein n=1 Tax=Aliiroseovarius sp. S1339 TaxID=2936990 RepID=UPI0020BFF96F|nr:NAD-dependent epimerase/dehydratase family protein [Aliiroseovarius sp. S1339]MCK8464171.1 NAD-dependent epimerase/dehydratase family protein [Aliiroseovarius sp. S1339]
MTSKYLIIGATGAIGHAFAAALQDAGLHATLLVRDRKKAIALFDNTIGFTIVEGDVNDTALLNSIAEGVDFIFHGANASYEHWAKAMPLMTTNVINAAEQSGATVIFPGNNYNFGKTDQPISEITPFNPSAPLGKVRVDLEKMLQRATDQGRIRTLIVRMAEIWGPNVTNKQFAPVFENALKGKAMPWLISTESAQQLLYAPDAGRAMVALSQDRDRKPYEVVNIGGKLLPSIQSWLEQIADVAGVPAKISVIPKFMLSLLGNVIPVMREVATMSYKYETSVILNDDKFRAAHPDFKQTPMNTAIADTLAWFKANGSDAPAKSRARRKGRIDSAVRFVVDNLAIGIFPAILAILATQVPALEGFLPYLAVAAGIYWTPGLHKLTDNLRGRFSKAT